MSTATILENLFKLEQLMGSPSLLPLPRHNDLDIPGLFCPSVPPAMARVSIVSETDRNAGLCVRDRCVNWQGHCVLGVAVTIAGKPQTEADIAECPIRSDCRWYRENGPGACQLCPALLHRELTQTMEMMTNER